MSWIHNNGKGSSFAGLEPCGLVGELSINREHRMAGGSQEQGEGGTHRQDAPLVKGGWRCDIQETWKPRDQANTGTSEMWDIQEGWKLRHQRACILPYAHRKPPPTMGFDRKEWRRPVSTSEGSPSLVSGADAPKKARDVGELQ